MSFDKQLHYAARTFDIIPNTTLPKNYDLERRAFNQVSSLELKDPNKKKQFEQLVKTINQQTYNNPYAINIDFTTNYNTRKIDKRNRTNIYDERLSANSIYINQYKQNPYSDRIIQIDQKNINAQKYKNTQVQGGGEPVQSFQEYLSFKKKMIKSNDGTKILK